MTATISPLAVVVKREMKQSLLEQFIALHVADVRSSGETRAARTTYRLLARSFESPVVRALLANGAAIEEAGIEVEAIIAVLPPTSEDDVAWRPFPFPMRMRRTVHPRLLDAHEQLLLGPSTTWIGDSMRRDPLQRDAYETYADGCRTTADFARTSFERLQALTLPYRSCSTAPAVTDEEVLPLHGLAGIGEVMRPTTSVAGTRH